jgi:hypothetical protein
MQRVQPKTAGEVISKAVAGKVDVPALRAAVDELLSSLAVAREKYHRVGLMLIEAKNAVGHGNFQVWAETNLPDVPHRTLTRWMEAAQSALTITKLPLKISDGRGGVIDISSVVSSAVPDNLGEEAREARQLYLDFIGDKTLQDCVDAAAIYGEKPTKMRRAVGGLSGGYKGEDRKAFDAFIARDLRRIGSHLRHNLSPGQMTRICGAFDAAAKGWPREVLQIISETAKRELKLSDPERAARK